LKHVTGFGVQIFILLSTRIRKVLLKCSVFQFLPNSRHAAYTANYTKANPKPGRTLNLGKVIVKDIKEHANILLTFGNVPLKK